MSLTSVQWEVMLVWTVRNIGGVALFLAGTTWLWLTPAFASRGIPTSGAPWALTNVLCLLTVAAFGVASWGVFSRSAWWRAVALGSSVLGLIAVVTYWIAAASTGEPTETWTWNAFVHLLVLAGVFCLLLVPALERWVSRHVMSG